MPIRTKVAALLITVASIVSIPTTLGAATVAAPALTCTGPSSADQAGRQTIAPGINGLATVQTVTSKLHLFTCVSKTRTGGSGLLRTTLTTTAVTCSAFTSPHVWQPTATIVWKNSATSTLKLSFATSGSSRKAQVTGKVSAGLFSGRTVSAEFKWMPLISPGSQKLPAACANTVAYGDPGRTSIVGDVVFRTKAFTIN
jgi:hypothetical protein